MLYGTTPDKAKPCGSGKSLPFGLVRPFFDGTSPMTAPYWGPISSSGESNIYSFFLTPGFPRSIFSLIFLQFGINEDNK